METSRLTMIVTIVYLNVILLHEDHLVNSGDSRALPGHFPSTTQGPGQTDQSGSGDGGDSGTSEPWQDEVAYTADPGQDTSTSTAHVQDQEELEQHRQSLAEMLHYRGLENPPAPEHTTAPVPDYVSLVFAALASFGSAGVPSESQTISGVWTQSREQTVWGVKPSKETKRYNYVDLTYAIQAEVGRVQISRAELVFSKTTVSRVQLQICTEGRYVCTIQRWLTPDTFVNSGRTYNVLDVTRLFSQWTRERTNSETNTSFPVVFHVVKSIRAVRSTRLGSTHLSADPPVLAIYGNMPNVAELLAVLRTFGVRPQTGKTQQRVKRSLLDVPTPDNSRHSMAMETQCSVRPWYVSFATIGWDMWILEPPGFNSNLCVGECNAYGNITDFTNHAILKCRMREEMMSGPFAHRSGGALNNLLLTCIPETTSPISVMFRSGNNTHVTRVMQDMVVDACYCV